MAFNLSEVQVKQLVVDVAHKLGIIPQNDIDISEEQYASARAAILAREAIDVPSATGLFNEVYETVAGWLTDEQTHLPISEEIDKSSWVFLRAAANVNEGGQTAEGFIARKATEIQYELRIGEADDALISKMSNSIAFNIMKDIIDKEGQIPTIGNLGKFDASAVINDYFQNDRGGWFGNALFHYFGERQFFEVLNPATSQNGTYDIFASMYSMQRPMFEASLSQIGSFWLSDTESNERSRFYVMAHNNLGTEGTNELVSSLSSEVDSWMSANYYEDWSGLFNKLYNPAHVPVLNGTTDTAYLAPIMLVGKLHEGNELKLSDLPYHSEFFEKFLANQEQASGFFIRGGDESDTVIIEKAAKGIADGGKGVDELDLTQISPSPLRLDIVSKSIIGGNEALAISIVPDASLGGTIPIGPKFYGYNFEKLKLGDTNDELILKQAHVPSLKELNTGGGDDWVDSTVKNLKIDLGSGNDELARAGDGSVIYTGGGHDTLNFSAGVIVEDANGLDRLVVRGNIVHEAISYDGTESGRSYFGSTGNSSGPSSGAKSHSGFTSC